MSGRRTFFSERECNYRTRSYGTWWLTQFPPLGMVKGTAPLQRHREEGLRPELYLEAMKENGANTRITEQAKVTRFDSTLDACGSGKYATSSRSTASHEARN